MAFFELGAADRGIDQKTGCKASLEQAADRLVQLGYAVARQSAKGWGAAQGLMPLTG